MREYYHNVLLEAKIKSKKLKKLVLVIRKNKYIIVYPNGDIKEIRSNSNEKENNRNNCR